MWRNEPPVPGRASPAELEPQPENHDIFRPRFRVRVRAATAAAIAGRSRGGPLACTQQGGVAWHWQRLDLDASREGARLRTLSRTLQVSAVSGGWSRPDRRRARLDPRIFFSVQMSILLGKHKSLT